MWGMLTGHPPGLVVPNAELPIAEPVEYGPPIPCGHVDHVTGAVCTRSTHHPDHGHKFEDQDWTITWPATACLLPAR